MTASPKILISVLNYNNAHDVLETIACLQAQTYAHCDLQLVDNASTTDCVAPIRQRFPELHVIQLEHNTGYMGGNNYAFDMALQSDYDYVLICNHDIIVAPDIVARLVAAAEERTDCGVMGVVEVDHHDGHVMAIGGHNIRLWKGKGEWLKASPSTANAVMQVDYAQGAMVMVARRAIERGLRLDMNLFMYCDEIDLAFQLRSMGLKAYVDVGSRIRHKHLPTPFSPMQGYCIQRNRLYLSKKHASRGTYALAVAYTGLIELPIKAVLRTVQGRAYYAWSCLLGFCDAIRGKMGSARAIQFAKGEA